MKHVNHWQVKQSNEKFLEELVKKKTQEHQKPAPEPMPAAPRNKEEFLDYTQETADRLRAQPSTSSPKNLEGMKPWEIKKETQRFLREDVPRVAAQRRIEQREAEGRSWFPEQSREALIKEYKEAKAENEAANAELESIRQEIARIKASH